MTAATSRLRRRGIGAGVAALVGLTSVAGLAGAAHAAPGFDPTPRRIAGADRYDTAIAASNAAFPFPGSARSVVLVSGTSTVDGLTASYVAGLNTAPILLVRNGVIDAATLAEITRLGATKVFIVGGTTVVPVGVETQLPNKTITRYGGADRYETASDAATNNGTVTTQPGKVFIASGTADALAAAPVLYHQGYPLLLTRPGSVPATTADALAKLTTTSRTVLGGTTAVDAATYTALGGTVRLQGANRFETATAVAASEVASEGFSADSVALANGNDTAAMDSLTGSAFMGINRIPLIFANGTDTIPAATTAYLTKNNAALVGQLVVFGGTSSVSAAAATAVVTTVTAPVASNPLAVTPTNGATLYGYAAGGSDNSSDDRTYGVSGSTAGTTYRVTLVAADTVRVAADGSVTFRSSADPASATGFSADPGTPYATITAVNGGVVAGSSRTATATPVNGALSFTIDGSNQPESVIPVVHLDGAVGRTAAQGGTSTRLETSATTAGAFAAATEPFGLGGVTVYAKVGGPLSLPVDQGL